MEAWRRSDPGAVPCLALASRINRALRSFGWYGMLGELTTLTTALVLLPACVMVLPSCVGSRAAAWRKSPDAK